MGKDYFLIMVGESDVEISKIYIVEASSVTDAISKFDECVKRSYKRFQINKLSRTSVLGNIRDKLSKPFVRNDVFAFIP